MKKWWVLLLVFCVALSCVRKKKIPKDILPSPKMEAILWDMISAGEFLSAFVLTQDTSVNKDSASLKVYGQVFQVHRITMEQFDKSFSYYRDHPELMKVIVDSLSGRQGAAGRPPWHADTARLRRPFPVKAQ